MSETNSVPLTSEDVGMLRSLVSDEAVTRHKLTKGLQDYFLTSDLEDTVLAGGHDLSTQIPDTAYDHLKQVVALYEDCRLSNLQVTDAEPAYRKMRRMIRTETQRRALETAVHTKDKVRQAICLASEKDIGILSNLEERYEEICNDDSLSRASEAERILEAQRDRVKRVSEIADQWWQKYQERVRNETLPRRNKDTNVLEYIYESAHTHLKQLGTTSTESHKGKGKGPVTEDEDVQWMCNSDESSVALSNDLKMVDRLRNRPIKLTRSEFEKKKEKKQSELEEQEKVRVANLADSMTAEQFTAATGTVNLALIDWRDDQIHRVEEIMNWPSVNAADIVKKHLLTFSEDYESFERKHREPLNCWSQAIQDTIAQKSIEKATQETLDPLRTAEHLIEYHRSLDRNTYERMTRKRAHSEEQASSSKR